MCLYERNHIVEDSSGDIILPKHLVNPTNHYLVRHLERLSSYFWPMTFLTWFTIFSVCWPLNGIAPLIMAEINPKHGVLTSFAWSRYDKGRRPFDINIHSRVWRLVHTFGECTRHFIQCGLLGQPSTKTVWYKIQTQEILLCRNLNDRFCFFFFGGVYPIFRCMVSTNFSFYGRWQNWEMKIYQSRLLQTKLKKLLF